MSEPNSADEPFVKYDMEFAPVDPSMPPAKPGPLHVVRGEFRKYDVEFAPADPSLPPATPGPLNHVRRRFRRIEMEPVPVTGFDLVLTLDGTADAGEVFARVCDLITELDRFARVSGGSGLTLDTRRSTAVPGTVTLRVVPADPDRGPRQAEVAGEKARDIPGVSDVKVIAA